MKAPLSKPVSESATQKRSCYCGALSAEFLRQQNIPDGYCGKCERCGQPGHTQHFPGPVPYTGAWCDRCVRIVAWTWPLKNPAVWVALIVALIVLVTFLRQ